MNGLELLTEIKKRRPESLVILMTAYAHGRKRGRRDEGRRLRLRHQAVLARADSAPGRSRAAASRGCGPRIARCATRSTRVRCSSRAAPRCVRLLETARQAAASDATVLLSGESGTGKNVLARQIHRWSPRQSKPFVVVNCTTLSEELLESELFGHVRGAFTGAIKDKPGRLEAADGGTVFLDEIADLSSRRCKPSSCASCRSRASSASAASARSTSTSRIIAASNRDLRSEVAAHRFREDLFYRLNVITLRGAAAARAPRGHPAARAMAARPSPACATRMPTAACRPERPPRSRTIDGRATCASCATRSSAPPC